MLERCHQLAVVIVIDSSNSSERAIERKINTTVTESAPRGEEEETSSDVGRKRPREQEGA